MIVYIVFCHTPCSISLIDAFSSMESAKNCAKEYLRKSGKKAMRIATVDCKYCTHNDIWLTDKDL